MKKRFFLFKKGFIAVSELIILIAIMGILAIIILSTTTKTLQNNIDDGMKPKLEQDLWGN